MDELNNHQALETFITRQKVKRHGVTTLRAIAAAYNYSINAGVRHARANNLKYIKSNLEDAVIYSALSGQLKFLKPQFKKHLTDFHGLTLGEHSARLESFFMQMLKVYR